METLENKIVELVFSDWEVMDYFTRGHQLQFIFFKGLHFFDLVTLTEKKIQRIKINKK
jgi:hypothetical protein